VPTGTYSSTGLMYDETLYPTLSARPSPVSINALAAHARLGADPLTAVLGTVRRSRISTSPTTRDPRRSHPSSGLNGASARPDDAPTTAGPAFRRTQAGSPTVAVRGPSGRLPSWMTPACESRDPVRRRAASTERRRNTGATPTKRSANPGTRRHRRTPPRTGRLFPRARARHRIPGRSSQAALGDQPPRVAFTTT